MEVSSSVNVRVSATDFSIDRILSSETTASSNTVNLVKPPVSPVPDTAPHWLYCTRYQPPRIPRGSSASCRGRSRRAGRHARVPFTAGQSTALEAAFERAPYLAPPALRALAHALQLREDRIKIWFQNRRARERRENSNYALSPQAVSIPATYTSGRATSGSTSRLSVYTLANFTPHRLTIDNERLRDVEEEERAESPVDVEYLEDVEQNHIRNS